MQMQQMKTCSNHRTENRTHRSREIGTMGSATRSATRCRCWCSWAAAWEGSTLTVTAGARVRACLGRRDRDRDAQRLAREILAWSACLEINVDGGAWVWQRRGKMAAETDQHEERDAQCAGICMAFKSP